MQELLSAAEDKRDTHKSAAAESARHLSQVLPSTITICARHVLSTQLTVFFSEAMSASCLAMSASRAANCCSTPYTAASLLASWASPCCSSSSTLQAQQRCCRQRWAADKSMQTVLGSMQRVPQCNTSRPSKLSEAAVGSKQSLWSAQQSSWGEDKEDWAAACNCKGYSEHHQEGAYRQLDVPAALEAAQGSTGRAAAGHMQPVASLVCTHSRLVPLIQHRDCVALVVQGCMRLPDFLAQLLCVSPQRPRLRLPKAANALMGRQMLITSAGFRAPSDLLRPPLSDRPTSSCTGMPYNPASTPPGHGVQWRLRACQAQLQVAPGMAVPAPHGLK